MPSYDSTPTASQFFNSGLNAMGTMVGLTTDAIKEKTRSDLLYMQAQYDSDQHDFLMDLNNRSDYNNFQQYIDDFENKTAKSFTDKNSKYYCSNPFTQKKANEMLESQKVALRNKVNEVINQRVTQDVMATDRETMKANRKNMDPQQALDANATLYANWFSNNYINKEQYNNLLLEEQALCYQQSVDTYFQNNVQSAIDNNLSAEKFWDEMEKNNEGLKDLEVRYIPTDLASPENMASGANLTTIKLSADSDVAKKVKKMWTQDYNAAVAEMQEENYTKLSELYTTMISSQNPVTQLQQCRNALVTIDTQMKGNRLTDEKRVHYTQLFNTWIKALSSGSGSGSGSKESLDSIKTLLDYEPGTVSQLVKDGVWSLEDAKNNFELYFNTNYNINDYKETVGMTPTEKQAYFNENFQNIAAIKIFTSDAVKDKRKQYPDLDTKLTNLENDIHKHGEKYIDGAESYLADLATKIICNLDNNTDVESVMKQIDTAYNCINIKAMNNMFEEKHGGFMGINHENDTEYLIRTAKELNDNDVVHISEGKKDLVFAPGAEEKLNTIYKAQENIINKVTGSQIVNSFQEKAPAVKGGTKNNDVTSNRIYETADGKQYRVLSTQNGNGKDSVEIQQILTDKNGKKSYVTVANEDAIKASLKGNDNADITAIQKNAENKSNTLMTTAQHNQDMKLESTAKDLQKANKLPPAVDKMGFNKPGKEKNAMQWADPGQRQVLMQDTINKIDKEADKVAKSKDKVKSQAEFKNKTGIDYNTWINLQGTNNKRNFILNQ